MTMEDVPDEENEDEEKDLLMSKLKTLSKRRRGTTPYSTSGMD